MAKKKLSATQKERKAIRSAIKRYEAKGVRFSDKLKNELKTAGFQKLKSYHQKGFRKLLSSGSAISESGETISGLAKRRELRSISARKAAQTRRESTLRLSRTTPEYTYTPEQLADERKRQKQQEKIEKEHADLIDEGKIIHEWINGIISDFSAAGHGNTGIYLDKFLDDEINQFGFDTVMAAIGQVPDQYKEEAQNVIFYEHDGENLTRALDAITHLIRGSILELQEKRELYDAFESELEF